MDLGLFLTCLFFGTLFDSIALEKTKSSGRSLDKLLPLILKPTLITDSKTVNKDYSLKDGTILPTGDDITLFEASKTKKYKSKKKKTKEPENKKDNKIDYFECDPDCPGCDIEDDSDVKNHFNAKLKVNDEQKPVQAKTDNVRKVIEMKIEKPYIIHNDHISKDKTKICDTPDIVIPINDKLGALVNPNGNFESQNLIEKLHNDIQVTAQNTVSVKPAPVLVTPSPNLNLVKIENDYHMKEYKELYVPYYRYISNYPYSQIYCYNQNRGNYNLNKGYNGNQNNGYRCNQNNGYSYTQNSVGYQQPFSKIWRTVSYTSRNNGEIVNQKVSAYIPVFDNNCYSTGTERIGGYAYYFNHNIY